VYWKVILTGESGHEAKRRRSAGPKHVQVGTLWFFDREQAFVAARDRGIKKIIEVGRYMTEVRVPHAKPDRHV